MLWGIAVIEPSRLPFPIIYEAVARGLTTNLNDADRNAIRFLCPWAFRDLQGVVSDLAQRVGNLTAGGTAVPKLGRRVSELLDLQEQLGVEVLDSLDEGWPDWADDLANDTWNEVGGW